MSIDAEKSISSKYNLPNFMVALIKRLKKLFAENIEKLTNITQTNFDLGVYHMYKGNFRDAIMRFKMITWMDSGNADSYYYIGRCLYNNDNNKQEALNNFIKATEIDKKHIEAKFFIDLLNNKQNLHLPSSIIRDYFNNIADDYSKKFINKFEYCAVDNLCNTIIANRNIFSNHLDILDLGCGTGLVGANLNDLAIKSLTGVDFANQMLLQANRLINDNSNKIYSKTICVDIVTYLQETDKKFDLIVASGILEYVDNFQDIFQQIVSKLSDKGVFAFIIPTGIEKFDKNKLHYIYNKNDITSIISSSGLQNIVTEDTSIYIKSSGNMWVLQK
jgi:predicted TPR repeat methyltransferase